jgi:hypothetical protein
VYEYRYPQRIVRLALAFCFFRTRHHHIHVRFSVLVSDEESTQTKHCSRQRVRSSLTILCHSNNGLCPISRLPFRLPSQEDRTYQLRHLTNRPPNLPGEGKPDTEQSGTVLSKPSNHNSTSAKMSYGTNTAPTIDSQMLLQLLLCIGLPLLILPLLATAGYFGFRWLKARKSKTAGKDIEKGELVETSKSEDDEEESIEMEPRAVLTKTPALISNSVQVPVGLGRNF